MAIPINLCSRCDKPAETFNKDWVCVDCMSGQLLDWQETVPDPKAQYLLERGWKFGYEHFETGSWKLQEGDGTYHTGDLNLAFREQKGREGVALWEAAQKHPWEFAKMNEDMVNNPPHYNPFGIEVIDILEMYFPDNPHLWNAGKYLLRSGYKGKEIEDLKKMVFYVQRYIAKKERGDTDPIPSIFEKQGNP